MAPEVFKDRFNCHDYILDLVGLDYLGIKALLNSKDEEEFDDIMEEVKSTASSNIHKLQALLETLKTISYEEVKSK